MVLPPVEQDSDGYVYNLQQSESKSLCQF